jgi:SAM-dependent methyltransferase
VDVAGIPMTERADMVARLPELMRSLYATGEYFVSIPRGPEAEFEEGYWHEIVDPDGVSRDRLGERERYLADIQGELDYVGSLDPGAILDAGCGLGWFLSALDDRWDRFGLEVSEFAAERAGSVGDVRAARLEECPFPTAAFDVVFCHHVIEHVDDPFRAVAQLRRVLKPGGKLIIGTPDFDSGAARRYGPGYRLLHDPTHISLFSNESMHRFLRGHGFRIERVEYPFFETRHFNEEALLRLLDDSGVSPPFYGNFMTFYCERV